MRDRVSGPPPYHLLQQHNRYPPGSICSWSRKIAPPSQRHQIFQWLYGEEPFAHFSDGYIVHLQNRQWLFSLDIPGHSKPAATNWCRNRAWATHVLPDRHLALYNRRVHVDRTQADTVQCSQDRHPDNTRAMIALA